MNDSDSRRRIQGERPTVLASAEPLLITLVQDPDAQVKCRDAIGELRGRSHIPTEVAQYLHRDVAAQDPQQALDGLEVHLADHPLNSAIVISDGFASPATSTLSAQPQSTHLGEEIRDRFGNNLLGMIAITDWAPQRVPDIDRIVSRRFTPDGLAEALQLTIRALQYKTPTEKASLTLPVTVRRVRTLVELHENFKLRHEVYSTMGYLDAELEASPTKIEVDLCDLDSIHICAMEQLEIGTRIVGAARLILTEEVDGELRDGPERIARADPVLRHRFRPPYPHLKLPVWQSQEVYNRITQMYRSGEQHGEISRVVVARSHRGTGLAKLLVNFTIHEARAHGLSRLFLECVPLHRPLYHKFGFVELPGTYKRVVNVDTTVVAMELKINDEPSEIGDTTDFGSVVLAEQNHLCACEQRECYSQGYPLYRTEECRLHYRPGQPR